LDAFLSVFEAEFESRLRDADGARRRLDARGFEGLHELLEALALLAAEKIFRLHLEIVEAKLELLHAAIAEHADLAAGHALRGERISLAAARLLGEHHRQPPVARLV